MMSKSCCSNVLLPDINKQGFTQANIALYHQSTAPIQRGCRE
ncbi:MAG: hypothetical protein V3U75_09175 [Methylococcaceae bacterium]